MKNKHRRIYFIFFLLTTLAMAIGLTLYGLRDGVSYFYSPSDVAMGKAAKQKTFRLGGVVKKNSIKKTKDGVNFVVTDFVKEIKVAYRGLPPSLFRENSGVIATGQLTDNNGNEFIATDMLAKHDENYMPPEVVKAIKDAGEWRDQDSAKKRDNKMIASFGELAVWLAWVISGLATVVGYAARDPRTIKKQLSFLWSLSTTSCGLILFAFFSLLYVFLASDFSVWLVVKNSHQQLPWFYKIGATWGNHEGSMLLWVLVLSLLAVLLLWLAMARGQSPDNAADSTMNITMARAVATQQLMVFLFSAYMLFTSNPFLRLDAPAGGAAIKAMDLNPLLQDPGLIFHRLLCMAGLLACRQFFPSRLAYCLARTVAKKYRQLWLRCGGGLHNWRLCF